MDKMVRFEKGIEYKLYRKNGNIAERTAICTGINRNTKIIKFNIIGSEKETFKIYDTVFLKLKEDSKSEMACDLTFTTYLGIYATDRK